MSERNFFVIKRNDNKLPFKLKELSNDLIRLALDRQIGIHFNLVGYHDEFLKLKDIGWGNYFSLSDDFYTIETESLFDVSDCFEELEGQELTKELFFDLLKKNLIKKYQFLNDIINIVFKQKDIVGIDFYYSLTYSCELCDCDEIKVLNNDLTRAFVEQMFDNAKKMNMFGASTAKYELVNTKLTLT